MDLKVGPSTTKKVSKKISPKRKNDIIWGYIFIAPLIFGLLIFTLYPVVQTFFYSFTDLGAFGSYSWIGLDNFKKLIFDPVFWKSLKNTLVYTAVSVPFTVFLSIVIAALLNAKIKGLTIYRTLYFLPAVTMPAAIAMIWKWLYNSDFGLLNTFLQKLSIKGPSWITDPKIAIYSLVIVSIWSGVGYNMVIFLAGIQGISSTYYEAASIDGAGPFAKFFKITIPLLSPTIFFVVVMSLIGAFQTFDLIFMMIGPKSIVIDQTQSVVFYFYKNAFIFQEKGYASAIVLVLFFIIMAITAIQTKLQEKWVNY